MSLNELDYYLDYGFGKHYFSGTREQGIYDLIINGCLTIRIIPSFESHEFKYPPSVNKLYQLHDLERDFQSKNEHRYYGFLTADIILYVDRERKGETDVLKLRENENAIVYFIDNNQYKSLVRVIRDQFPFNLHKVRVGGKARKSRLGDNYVMKFLEEFLPHIHALLSENKIRELIFLHTAK